MVQKTTLDENAAIVRYDVTLTNETAKTFDDIRYMRCADPDQAGQFASVNTILSDSAGTMVAGKPVGSDHALFMFTKAPAVGSAIGFVNTDPYSSTVTVQSPATTKSADVTLNLNLSLGTLAPGFSISFTIFTGATKDIKATKELLGK